MKSYPSIDSWKKSVKNESCHAFYKYDGSNLRWEWNPKKGFFKFGTRTQLFDHTSSPWNQAIPLFKSIEEDIVEVMLNYCGKKKPERLIAYTEFFGSSSFAGTHVLNEPKRLKLFDVEIYKQGILPAKDFVKLFSGKEYAAELIYQGNMNTEFIQKVRNNQLDTKLNEGVVCKGLDWMAKIKTIEYINKLKALKNLHQDVINDIKDQE